MEIRNPSPSPQPTVLPASLLESTSRTARLGYGELPLDGAGTTVTSAQALNFHHPEDRPVLARLAGDSVQERDPGPEHPDTLTSLNNLAGLLESKEDHAAGEPFYRRALEALERGLGPEHPYTLISLNNLAALLHAKGNHAGAEPLLRRVL
ncbi:MAG: Kinesin light chain, partial [Verrucomicrobiales bacterium]|nr:Kinesin light chain [Verrucomicrobiales bacterium]